MAEDKDIGKVSFRFGNDEMGRTTFTLKKGEEEHSGVYENQAFLDVVNSLGLRIDECSELLYRAASRCMDTQNRRWLMKKAYELGQDWEQIVENCARFNYSSTLFSAADVSGGEGVPTMRNGGAREAQPNIPETFSFPRALGISEKQKKQLADDLEWFFVRNGQGELALKMLGVDDTRMLNYLTWRDKMYSLTATIQFLLGRKELPLLDDTPIGGIVLPAGLYGNKQALAFSRSGGDNHWTIVAAVCRNGKGEVYDPASLRATAARDPKAHQAEVSKVLYVFRYFIFEPDSTRPLSNGLYQPWE